MAEGFRFPDTPRGRSNAACTARQSRQQRQQGYAGRNNRFQQVPAVTRDLREVVAKGAERIVIRAAKEILDT